MQERFNAQTHTVKDNDENLITNEESMIQKFQKHFENILIIDHENTEESGNVVYCTTQPLFEAHYREEWQI